MARGISLVKNPCFAFCLDKKYIGYNIQYSLINSILQWFEQKQGNILYLSCSNYASNIFIQI